MVSNKICYMCGGEIDETREYIIDECDRCICHKCFVEETITVYYVGGEFYGTDNDVLTGGGWLG